MSDYRAAVGSNVALASLTVINPQPTSPGLKATRRIFLGNGSVLDEGLYVEWIYSMVETPAQLTTILTPLGIQSLPSATVTIYTRNPLYQYKRYTGTAIQPEATWENYFIRNMVIIIRDLKLLP